MASGALRVGMESWMVGRQCVVWQHPECFVRGLQVTLEVSGRTKCKQTKTVFVAGERRLSATAHKTTAHIKLSAAPALLRPVFDALSERSPPSSSIEGFNQLSSDENLDFTDAMEKEIVDVNTSASAEFESAGTQSNAEHPGNKTAHDESTGKQKQPPKGKVSKATGKVCWLFAGKKCYGNLLPGQETVTTCYARTHKGNTKTLAKGGKYWWMHKE